MFNCKRKSANNADSPAKITSDALKNAFNIAVITNTCPHTDVIKLALQQLNEALQVGFGVFTDDELEITSYYRKEVEKMQRAVEERVSRPSNRFSTDSMELQVKEETVGAGISDNTGVPIVEQVIEDANLTFPRASSVHQPAEHKPLKTEWRYIGSARPGDVYSAPGLTPWGASYPPNLHMSGCVPSQPSYPDVTDGRRIKRVYDMKPPQGYSQMEGPSHVYQNGDYNERTANYNNLRDWYQGLAHVEGRAGLYYDQPGNHTYEAAGLPPIGHNEPSWYRSREPGGRDSTYIFSIPQATNVIPQFEGEPEKVTIFSRVICHTNILINDYIFCGLRNKTYLFNCFLQLYKSD